MEEKQYLNKKIKFSWDEEKRWSSDEHILSWSNKINKKLSNIWMWMAGILNFKDKEYNRFSGKKIIFHKGTKAGFSWVS